jgi:hypothetical protein
MKQHEALGRIASKAKLSALAALPMVMWVAPAAASPETSVEKAATARSPWIGAGADVGLPDGATASIVVRPIRALRAHAGVSHNGISLGQRIGVSWVPLPWWFSPTLSVEYGHYAEGNANPLARRVMGDETFQSAVLERVGYDYLNGHVGLEFGRKWFTFYIHAGMSRISGTVHNIDSETMTGNEGTTTISFPIDPSITVWAPSARIGFVVYLAK